MSGGAQVRLVLDIDGTLCASPRVPNGDDFAAWERLILDGSHPVVDGAREGVRDLVTVCTDAIVFTGRSERLRGTTEQWIADAFPILRGVGVYMRERGDLRPSALVKWDALHAWHGGADGPFLIVDDDPSMRVACRERDRFLLAPSCWMAEVRSVVLSIGAAGRGARIDGETA